MRKREILALLPVCVQSAYAPQSPFDALIECMEYLHGDSEAILDTLEKFFNPMQTPKEFLPLLSYWVDLSWLFTDHVASNAEARRMESPMRIPPQRLAALIVFAASLNKYRGTTQGLKTFLQLATGVNSFEIRESAEVPFHIKVSVKSDSEVRALESFIRLIIDKEKPAFATYSLEFVQ
jgi:phage tail-like protein